MAAVAEVEHALVVPEPIVDPGAWAVNYWYSALGVICVSRTARGSL